MARLLLLLSQGSRMQALVIMSLLAQLDVFQPKFFLSLSHRKARLPGDKARGPNKMRSRENSLWSRCIRRNPVLIIHRIFTMEMWTAKELLDYATFSKLQARPGKGGREEALLKALKSAEADGMPLKTIATASDGSKSITEVVKADKKSLPASTFEIPADYTKSAGGMMDMMGGMAGSQTDEAKKKMGDAQKQMDDAMKNMTPEQREMIQKMMKQQKAGSQ